MLRPDLLENLAGVHLIGLNLPLSYNRNGVKVGCAFKGNATKRLRIWVILTHDERQDQRTMFCPNLTYMDMARAKSSII